MFELSDTQPMAEPEHLWHCCRRCNCHFLMLGHVWNRVRRHSCRHLVYRESGAHRYPDSTLWPAFRNLSSSYRSGRNHGTIASVFPAISPSRMETQKSIVLRAARRCASTLSPHLCQEICWCLQWNLLRFSAQISINRQTGTAGCNFECQDGRRGA